MHPALFRLLAFFLLCASCLAAEPKRLLLIGQGPDGHPPTTHEFMGGVRVMEALLAQFSEIKTTSVKADGAWPEGPGLIDKADGVLLLVSQGAKWMQEDAARHEAFKRLAARKGAI